ncbi:MAG: asparagine synthase (glutamine-hydrolyzing) [Alphaproteobacteria bacterium]
MCGIFGFYGPRAGKISEEVPRQMQKLLHHRGPDDGGLWTEESVTFGQTRLSILDLSPAGHQPMFSASGRFAITFNGEIYNFLSLKKTLIERGFSSAFRGHSDTEILLECLEHLGIQETLSKSVGMFAFALWDRQTKTLYLGRDRFGEKPLYYGIQKGILAFASELKALKPLKDLWDFQVNEDILKPYVQYGYIPGTASVFKNIWKVQPGTYLEIHENLEPKSHVYWSAVDQAERSRNNQLQVSFSEAKSMLADKLKESISLQKVADVPVGAFLSGGVDSSLVAALMQSVSKHPVKTFTIGFHESKFDEAPYAKQVAENLKTDHTEVYLTQKETLDIVADIPKIYSEPFADSSQIPTYLVSRIARKNVTVCISGDGGDELFGGYGRYFHGQKIWDLVKHLPNPLPKVMGHVLKGVPEQLQVGGFPLGDKAHKLSDLFKKANSREDVYNYLISAERDPDQLVLNHSKNSYSPLKAGDLSYQEWMMLTDSVTYLTDDILVKVDRAAMANSLETRVPLLDHRIFEFAWQLPLSYKIQGGQGKVILKSLLADYIPQNLIDRPKMGFGIPYGDWLRHELKPWANDLLSQKNLKEQGFFNPERVENYWQEHLSEKRQWQHILWNILMFQGWLREWDV